MNRFKHRRSLLAVAVAACSTAAYAQTPCDQEIRQLEQQIQQGQMDQQQQSAIRDLLQAAEQNPNDCDVYVARAQEVVDRRPGAEMPSPTADRPIGQQDTARQTAPSDPVAVEGVAPDPRTRPATTAQPSPQTTHQATEQDAVAQENAGTRQAGERADRTMDVQVDQPPAQVDVQTRSPSIVVKQQPAQVTVEQQPPEVEITQREPEITVDQPEPEVTINQAEPEVQVTQTEPEVEVEQSDPKVRVVQPEAAAQVRSDQARATDPQSDSEPRPLTESGSQSTRVSLQDVQGNEALSSTGEEIGEVQEFVRSRTDGSAYALIEVGGFLGIGARSIAIPLDQASVSREGQLQTPYSQDQIEQMDEYDEEAYQEIPESEFAALEAELESPAIRP